MKKFADWSMILNDLCFCVCVCQLSCVVCVSGSHVQPVDGSLAEIFDYFNK